MPTKSDTISDIGGSLSTRREKQKKEKSRTTTKPSRHRSSKEMYTREKKETQMHRHKIAPNEGSQAVALREAMIKLQELELQSTENRVKVGLVQTRVSEFLYQFESSFIGKNTEPSPEDYRKKMFSSCCSIFLILLTTLVFSTSSFVL
jgi:hypothetical protein